MKVLLSLPLLLALGGCELLPPNLVEAHFLVSKPLPTQFRLGSLKCLNPLLPSPENTALTDLVCSEGARYGFSIVEKSDSPLPTINLQYNEVDYDQDLTSVRSLTAFLSVVDPSTSETLASVFVSEDSKRTLESWSVLYSLVDSLFSKLKEENSKQRQTP